MSAPLVLVVDDDRGIREVISDVLADEGYEVACASDGREALAWLRSGGEPAMIILDLRMPNMSGEEFLELQRRDAALARICTAVMTANRAVPPSAVAANHFLRKPIRLEALLAAVAACCGPAN
jgi:CheY-like chemotaxis protein